MIKIPQNKRCLARLGQKYEIWDHDALGEILDFDSVWVQIL